jgi:penicillin-binding protein-related factor A (putative recombinase)
MERLEEQIHTKLRTSPIKEKVIALLKKANIDFSVAQLDDNMLYRAAKVISDEYRNNKIKTDDLGIYFGNLFTLADKNTKSQSRLATFCLEMTELDLYLRSAPDVAMKYLNTLLSLDL